MQITVYGDPVAKPRQTRSDKWKQRPCVIAYRAWADVARMMAFRKNSKVTLTKPTMLTVRAYFDSGKTHRCGPHTAKVDIDNVCKAVMDALFMNDQFIYRIDAEKLWCDGGSPRVVIGWGPDEVSHVCGLQGFGRSLDDYCPACREAQHGHEAER